MLDLFAELENCNEMLTPAEVAKLMRVSHRTVQRMIATREIPSILVGAQRRIDPASLSRQMKKRYPDMARMRQQAARSA